MNRRRWAVLWLAGGLCCGAAWAERSLLGQNMSQAVPHAAARASEYVQGPVRLQVRAAEADAERPFVARTFATGRRILSVEYTLPGGGAPSRVVDASKDFEVSGKATGAARVSARVRLAPARRRGREETVVVEGAVPGAAAALPAGLSFKLDVLPQSMEGTASPRLDWRLQLLGNPAALAQVRSVSYTLPSAHFTRTEVDGRGGNFEINGDSPDAPWEFQAHVRLSSGATVEHKIPFRK